MEKKIDEHLIGFGYLGDMWITIMILRMWLFITWQIVLATIFICGNISIITYK